MTRSTIPQMLTCMDTMVRIGGAINFEITRSIYEQA